MILRRRLKNVYTFVPSLVLNSFVCSFVRLLARSQSRARSLSRSLILSAHYSLPLPFPLSTMIYLSLCLSLCLSVRLSVYLSGRLSTSVCTSICLFVCLSVCLSVCLFTFYSFHIAKFPYLFIHFMLHFFVISCRHFNFFPLFQVILWLPRPTTVPRPKLHPALCYYGVENVKTVTTVW